MKKQKLKARIRYEQKEDGREGYAVEILTHEGTWGLDRFFYLVAREGDDEKNFIHWTIFEKLAGLQALGYEIDFGY